MKLRVSSEISNGAIILNVYGTRTILISESVKDALCFFMGEKKGHEFHSYNSPRNFNNITKNDVCANFLQLMKEADFHGLDGHVLGGDLYLRRPREGGREMASAGDIVFKGLTAALGATTLYLAATFSINLYRGISWHTAQSVSLLLFLFI
ncbi:hypothetical protein ZIOFF_020213 [Zingiber officinale]|uniref:Uncharacterized protein n=1 Tax=Zingiber officinale TaxID=94328 RepID=A0A8J5HAZ1_ZINOF|nr:hypothetical protein ZIOFF_020213 [Zingiber officinale]